MDEYGQATCLKVTKLYEPASSRYLDQKPWSEQNEKHHRHKHWPPISHLLSLSMSAIFLISLFHYLYMYM
ncbi:hypothetical protein Fmac_029280 [Flemingia macrophylla]|uniref:Uncharacterized protein n=1 Tax=Flemingia macrophylla TaxID=520843 RepID=A0ABD1LA05_9FABA